MGGTGSGHYRPHKRAVESFYSLTAAYVADILDKGGTLRIGDQVLHTSTKRVGYGDRVFFLCPSCGAARAKLYNPNGYWACRVCHNLQYRSCQTSGDERARIWREANKIGRKLQQEVSPPDFTDNVTKPKHMKYATYFSHITRLFKLSQQWNNLFIQDAKKFLSNFPFDLG